MKSWIRKLAVLLAPLLLCSCGTVRMERERPAYTVGVVLKGMQTHYWMDMRSGMEQAAIDNGIDLYLLHPAGELETEEQNDLIADALDSDVDLLMVAPCDSYHTKWFVEQAQEQEIPVLTVDTRAFDTDLPYIGADNERVGKIAAEYLSEQLPAGARIVIMAGARDQASHVDRIGSFWRNLDTSFEVVHTFYTDVTQSDGYETAKQLEDWEIDGIFCASAVVGLGAATALAEMGQDARIVAVDTVDDALQALQDGAMDALVSQSGYDIGYQAITTAVETLRSGELPGDVLISGELLTKDSMNADGKR